MIPCSREIADCIDRFENTPFGLKQVFASKILLIFVVTQNINISVYNSLGGTITKYMTAFARITIDVIRIVIVGIISVLFGWESLNIIEVLSKAGYRIRSLSRRILHF
jgi:hypothetical protein